ncbi:MAG: hypothetical protein IJQ80_02350 [Clostridia bacterium]|nr:hypothetical protein [Clostridia bacterium]
MIVYKGTDKDMKCQGKQYTLGETATEDHAKICEAGIHACEYPLDVFTYYKPGRGSRYFVGDLDGVSCERDVDTKVVGKRLTLKAEIGIPGLAKAAVEYITERIDKDKVASANENRSAATNTGYRSAATNTGDRSAATNTGHWSAATNTGEEGFAIATGFESKARGALGCWLVLAEWAEKDGRLHIIDAQCRRVDGNVIKPDTFYQLKGGVFVEWKEQDDAED